MVTVKKEDILLTNHINQHLLDLMFPPQDSLKQETGELTMLTKRKSLKIANLADGRPDASIMNYVTEKGYFLDGRGNAYQQRGGLFGAPTEYNPDIHGLPVPLVKKQSKLMIGMSKKDDEINKQLIFNSGGANPEDYLTPKQLQRYLDNPDKFIDIDIDLVKKQRKKLQIA
jgi:hypothetical protein